MGRCSGLLGQGTIPLASSTCVQGDRGGGSGAQDGCGGWPAVAGSRISLATGRTLTAGAVPGGSRGMAGGHLCLPTIPGAARGPIMPWGSGAAKSWPQDTSALHRSHCAGQAATPRLRCLPKRLAVAAPVAALQPRSRRWSQPVRGSGVRLCWQGWLCCLLMSRSRRGHQLRSSLEVDDLELSERRGWLRAVYLFIYLDF